MKQTALSQRYPLAVLSFAVIVVAFPASAYVGPGAGLTAIGTVLSLVAAVFMAIVGFIWYPIKRLLRRLSQALRDRTPSGDQEE